MSGRAQSLLVKLLAESLVKLRLGFLVVLAVASTLAGAAAANSESYIGSTACASCHPKETRLWRESHHHFAMQPANNTTVLGNFNAVLHEEHGIKTKFFRRKDKFMVNTVGAGGTRADFEVSFTFGVVPLQQYLVGFPDGRYQVLAYSWDTRSVVDGGQRWYSIYPDETLPHDDVLHWTQPSQNWNHMCAECHSTNLRKNYDAKRDTFNTQWSELNVGCEACHGAGSVHAKRMKRAGTASARDAGESSARKETGLPVMFPSFADARWNTDPASEKPVRIPAPTQHTEVELCARCHSRRSTLVEAPTPGLPVHDSHRVATLDPALYYPDGQIRDEVYVYGSFIQSPMYRAGVTCSDCHDAHSGSLRAQGNDLCSRCHTPSKFDTSAHHKHAVDSPGAQCVACHMPTTTYMGIDDRRDHSLRVPRPDLSKELDTPNACNGCHESMTSDWAVKKVKAWYPNGRSGKAHWGSALHAGQWSAVDAEAKLVGVSTDAEVPAIARATAISLLPPFASERSLPAFPHAASDADPLVRTAALEALESFPEQMRVDWAAPRLDDPVRSVRFEAARVLASTPIALLREATAKKLESVMAEYVAAQNRDGDRAEPHMRLAELALAKQDLALAKREYALARERNPSFLPAYINLADLHRIEGDDVAGERVLREALEISAGQPDVRHALGLALIRLGRVEEAVVELELAFRGRPERPRYAYVYAAALNNQGQSDQALDVLRSALAAHPGDRDLRSFAASLARQK